MIGMLQTSRFFMYIEKPSTIIFLDVFIFFVYHVNIIICKTVFVLKRTMYMNNGLSQISLAILSLFVSQIALAEVVIPNSPSSDPGRISQRLLTPPPVNLTPAIRDISLLEAVSVPKNVRSFKLTHVYVEGNTAFSSGEIAAMVNGHIGSTVNSQSLKAMGESIGARYLEAGYPLIQVRVTTQGGAATFHISEGWIESVRVDGDINPSTAQVLRAYGARIMHERPLTMATLERYALLANDAPGISVKTALVPSERTPGAFELVFMAQQKKWDGYLSYDNRGTRILGPQEILAGIFANSWLGANRTGVEGLITKDFKEERFIGISHQQYVGCDGLNWFVYLNRVETEPGGIFKSVDTEGTATYFNATISYPIIRLRSHSLFVHGTFDALDSKVDEHAIPFRLFDDKIRSIRLGATFNTTDKWYGDNIIDAEISRGIDALGAETDPASNPGGKLNYTKLNLTYSRNQYITNHWSFVLGLTGQYSPDTLLTGEQFGFGGTVYGRGYDPSELLGDSGVAGRFELRYDTYFNGCYFSWVQVYGLFDAGYVWNDSSDSFFPRRASATSTGIGTRFDIVRNVLTGNLEVDKPLSRKVYLEGDKDARFYFGITARL